MKGLHLLHLNINSLQLKIDELRYIAKVSNAAVIGITESKLDTKITVRYFVVTGTEKVEGLPAM